MLRRIAGKTASWCVRRTQDFPTDHAACKRNACTQLLCLPTWSTFSVSPHLIPSIKVDRLCVSSSNERPATIVLACVPFRPQLEAGLDGFAYYLSDPGRLDCAGLTAALDGSGIGCPSVDKALVGTYASTLAVGRE